MALFMDIPRPSEPNNKQMANYMYQLEDMLRHVLSNIDTDNLAQGSKIIQVVDEDGGTAKALKKTAEEVKKLTDQRWKTDRAYAGMAKEMTGQRDGKKINIVLTLQNGETIQTGFFDTAGISAEDVGVRLPMSGAPAKYEDGQVTVNLELYSYAGGTGEITFSKGDSVTFRDEKGNGLAYDAGYLKGVTEGGGTGYLEGYEDAKEAYAPTAVVVVEEDTVNKTVIVRVVNQYQELLTNQAVPAQQIYSTGRSEGVEAGKESVTIAAMGWTGGSNRVEASNGKSVTVELPGFSVSGGDSFTGNKTTVYVNTPSVAGPLASKEVDATDVYTEGEEAGYQAGYSDGYAAGYEEAKKAVTVEGEINYIRNTAANYFFAQGYAKAYVDGEMVASDTFSAGQEINVGQ